MKAVFPGSFDPPTLAHIDIAESASRIFGSLVILVASNDKKHRMFTQEESLSMFKNCLKLPGVSFDILPPGEATADYCSRIGAEIIVRGISSAESLKDEITLSDANASISGVQTVFIPVPPAHSRISSSAVKSIMSVGHIPSGYVSSEILPLLHAKLAKK